jgi:hypothetical protein
LDADEWGRSPWLSANVRHDQQSYDSARYLDYSGGGLV